MDDLDDIDIYSGLGTTEISEDQETYSEVVLRAERLEKEKRALEKQVEAYKNQGKKLVLQNNALKKNMSCLYKTAKEEIARKDMLMAKVREERAHTQKPYSRSPVTTQVSASPHGTHQPSRSSVAPSKTTPKKTE
eukprot:m.16723 g.16723  ORF g.16723 m.16723 type:complete len:135 (-) comp11170_c0_seq1:268-672(-)